MTPRIIAILLTVTICFSATALSESEMSPPLTLSYARAAVAEMPLRQFATSDGRYLARGYQVVSNPQPNVFLLRVEIVPLRKNGN